jgi:serine/threonine protein kinase
MSIKNLLQVPGYDNLMDSFPQPADPGGFRYINDSLPNPLQLLPPFLPSSQNYTKLTRKMSQAPVGIGYSDNVGVFLHLKAFRGKGYHKKVSSAKWIKLSGEATPAVYKKLLKVPERETAIRVKLTERELILQSAFAHPSIVEVYFFATYANGSKIAIYEEACDDTLLNFSQKMNEQERLIILLDIADALTYMHINGYSHNDIKLSNILIKSKRGKLGDFGVCNTIGSPAFTYTRTRAPEQKTNSMRIGTDKTDVYQLGLCLWHVFHPNPPAGHLESDFAYPNDTLMNWNDDSHMHDLIGKCLAADPKLRPSMQQVKEILMKIQKTL